MRPRIGVCAIFLCVLVLSCAVHTAAQVNTATLSGTVTDPQGLAVRSAKVTVTNAATGAERSIVVDEDGRYIFIGLPPGQYKMTVRGGSNFSVFQNDALVVTVGENATFSPRLDLKGVTETVTVTTETAAIETSKTEVSQTVEQRRIDNLPINGRG
jgi:protocatechuate 3,4-dioxygenase beta subunit